MTHEYRPSTRYLWHKNWKQGVEKKTLFCLKFRLKNLYFIKNSLYEKPLFSKEPASGPGSLKIRVYNSLQKIFLLLFVGKACT